LPSTWPHKISGSLLGWKLFVALAISSKVKHFNKGCCFSLFKKILFLFLIGEAKIEEISLQVDICFFVFDRPLILVARGGDSVVLESPKLKVSSSVLCDSASSWCNTVLGEEFCLFVSELMWFSMVEEVLPLRVLPSSFLLNHHELGWRFSAINGALDRCSRVSYTLSTWIFS